MIHRFLLSGSGGQGVISMAIILAESASLHGGLEAVQSQSYGPEARGGATRSDVIISDEPILLPKVVCPNTLVALTNEACEKYLSSIRPNGLFLYDSDLVQPGRKVDAIYVGLPMYRTVMEALGKAQALNICALGALVTLTGFVSFESVQQCLHERFRPAFHAANDQALEIGRTLAASVPSI